MTPELKPLCAVAIERTSSPIEPPNGPMILYGPFTGEQAAKEWAEERGSTYQIIWLNPVSVPAL